MANHIKNPEMVQRNLKKIVDWNGEDAHDILDAATIIRMNGETIDLTQYSKPIPEEFEDFSGVESIIAIDTQGNILYADETFGDVAVLREKARREKLGLGPLDAHIEFIKKLIKDYQDRRNEEARQVQIRKRKTSAYLKSCDEVLMNLERIKGSLDFTLEKMEENLSSS